MRRQRDHGLTMLLVLVAAILGAGVILVAGPHSPRLSSTTTGDQQLAADIRASLTTDRGYQSLSAARLQDGKVTYAGLGDAGQGRPPTPQTPFELGSITKTFTGLLLADGIDRGELRLEAPLSTYLPELAGTAAGASTLRQLATHTAGLPSFPASTAPVILLRGLGNQNTYQGSTADVISSARATKIKNRDRYAYSNLGMTLLGYAEARAAGTPDWPTLATERIIRPLGLSHTTFAMTAADIPAGAARPHHENGWPAAHWYGPAFAPAGSATWTTAEDLMRYAQAVLDGTAPGAKALDPVQPIPNGQIGLAWHLLERDGRTITWHNGATGGFRTILALDRDRQQAVLIMGNSTRDTDTTARSLAAATAGTPVQPVERAMINWVSMITWTGLGLVLVLGLVPSSRRPQPRLFVVSAAISAVAGVLILLSHGPWMIIPAWSWGAVAGLAVALIIVSLRRSAPVIRPSPTPDPPRRRRRTRLSLVSSVLMIIFAVWTW
jgi:CubicO group peptidase (beta-lactamase class C family)